MHRSLLAVTLALAWGQALCAADARPNILFIASDDMRPQLGCYGDPTVKSPHIDALAKQGRLFSRSYVQQALCSPSRISMLSGRYPATTQIFEIGRTLRTTIPDITTMPQHFKNNGYHTRSLGKIYHVGIDDDASWTVPAWHSTKPRYSPETREALVKFRADAKAKGIEIPQKGKGSNLSVIPPFEAVDCGDDDLLDGDTTVNAIEQLREHAKNPSRPFLLAVGYANPHVPWISPKKYWDLYEPAKFPLATNEFLPKDAPEFAATSGNDFRTYAGVPEGILPEPYKRQCLHGYLAAISYVDAQVGRLLAALEETGLAKNTIVVFWSDHGYYMGEHTWWGSKHNNYEGATRNSFIMTVPGMKHAGEKSDALVQAVDIAPTLVELCGLPANEGFQGRSLKSLIEDPSASVNDAAFSWYPKAGWLGVTMRTNAWRFVEWTKAGQQPVRELYDMVKDPQNDENLANQPGQAKRLEELSAQLRQRFPAQDFHEPVPGVKGRKGKKAKSAQWPQQVQITGETSGATVVGLQSHFPMRHLVAASLFFTASVTLPAAIPGADSLAKLIINEFDTNSDELIDAGEWQGGITSSFEKLDSNGNGSITGAEIDGLQDDIGEKTGDLAAGIVTAIIKQIILTLDKDGDKEVGQKEFSDSNGAFFAKLDADSNGMLTRVELAELPTRLLGK